MKESLHRLRDGVIDFNRFAAETMDEWTRLAAGVLRGTPCTRAIELDDVRQAMLLGAWRAVQRWQPGGMTLHGYVVFGACVAGKRALRLDRHTHSRDWQCPLGDAELPDRRPYKLSLERERTFDEAISRLVDLPDPARVLDNALDVLRTARDEEQRRVVAGLICGASLQSVAAEVYPEASTSRRARGRQLLRARAAALTCLSRLEAEDRAA